MSLTNRLLGVLLGAMLGLGAAWLLWGCWETDEDQGSRHSTRETPHPGEAPAFDPEEDRPPPPMPASLQKKQEASRLRDKLGVVHRLDMSLAIRAPRVVKVGEPFQVVVVTENTGTLALSNVVAAVRDNEVVRVVDAESYLDHQAKYQRLAPQARRERVYDFVANRAGKVRISGSAREDRGWAAAGAYVRITAVAPEDYVPSKENADSTKLDLRVEAELLDEVVAGKPFRVRLSLENEGGVTLSNITFAWRGMGGIEVAEGGRRETGYEFLPVGKRDSFVVRFVAVPPLSEPVRITASAREERGWCAAGIYMSVSKDGLRAK